MDMAQETFNDNPDLLKKVITVANHGCMAMALKPKHNHPSQVGSNVKILFAVVFDCNGVVHHEFLAQGRTVNKKYHLEVMRRLRKVIRQKRTELWKNQSWKLCRDNAPAHTSILVHEFLS